MTRRSMLMFGLELLAAGLIVPEVDNEASDPDQLKFTKMPADSDSFAGPYMLIEKGAAKAIFHYEYACNLVDCHGLCASVEMAVVLIDQLEYGGQLRYIRAHELADVTDLEYFKMKLTTPLRVPFSHDSGFIELKRQKIVQLTIEEKRRICELVKEYRGDHDCVCGGY